VEKVATNVVSSLLKALGRQIKDAAWGTAEEQAIARCVKAGLGAIAEKAECETEEALRHLIEEVFARFFADPTVARPVARSLTGTPIDIAELRQLFGECGFDTETLPGIGFDAAIEAFRAGFAGAAAEESALRSHLIFVEHKAQTEVQRQSLGELRHEGHEEHYLRTLIAKCEALDLPPIDETYPQGRRPGDAGTVGITDVFTDLDLARLTRRLGQDLAALVRGDAEDRVRAPTQERKTQQPIPALDAIGAMPRLVVLGQPRGGKSSLVNYLAVQLARKRLGEPGAAVLGWPDGPAPLPVRIVLRQFAAWLSDMAGQAGAGSVWNHIAHQFDTWGCREAYPKPKCDSEAGGGIVFFDGLDEVSEHDEKTKRTAIKNAIDEFALPLVGTRIVVTSRVYAYRKDDAWRLPEDRFPVAELDLFSRSQIEAFARAWYRIVGPWKGWDEGKSLAEANGFYRAIGAHPHLDDLARYPLLLTLMARVHGRDGTLPQDRADLYQRAVDLLLARWENRLVRDESGVRSVEQGLVQRLGLSTETLRQALEGAACEAHERQESYPSGGERAADGSPRGWTGLDVLQPPCR
jgi:hypothetical protein